jgi:ribokinase
VQKVVMKLGEGGCLWLTGTEQVHSPAISVRAIDSTAAGDTFNGALAVALAEGMPVPRALRFANTAAGLSVTRIGAQASIPSRADVDQNLTQD